MNQSAALDLQPTLRGKNITLRALDTSDFEALYAAASDPLIWAQHPDSLRYRRDIFEQRYFEGAMDSKGALIVIENQTQQIIGATRFYQWNPQAREISIGYTFLACRHWGTGINGEMKALVLAHAFTAAETVWFHIGKDNMRSRKAVEKLGAVLSHEEDRELDGQAFVQLYYKLKKEVDNSHEK